MQPSAIPNCRYNSYFVCVTYVSYFLVLIFPELSEYKHNPLFLLLGRNFDGSCSTQYRGSQVFMYNVTVDGMYKCDYNPRTFGMCCIRESRGRYCSRSCSNCQGSGHNSMEIFFILQCKIKHKILLLRILLTCPFPHSCFFLCSYFHPSFKC